MLFGLPAVFSISAAFYFVVSFQASTSHELRERYLKHARSAASAGDWQRAMLFFQRSFDMGMRNKDDLFELAEAAEKTGNEGLKVAVLERLAPVDNAVHARSHIWKACNLLQQGTITLDEARLVEQQLKFALQLEPDNEIAAAHLGELYYAQGMWAPAVQYLQRSDRENTGHRLMMAKAMSASGDPQGAIRTATEVAETAKGAVRMDPGNLERRLDWAEATLIQKEHSEALAILLEGLKLHDNPKLRDAISSTLILWSDAELEKSESNRQRAFEILSQGFVYSPNEIVLFDRLLKILKGGDDLDEDIQSFLQRNIASGTAPGLSHLILGTYLFERKQQEKAGFHLDQAFKLLPTGPIVANNLAWYLIRTSPEDPERALAIIDSVIRSYPDGPEYHDTRGHVLLKLERWQESVTEFEYSLSTLGSRKETHMGLATAYHQLGMEDIAKQHERIIQEKYTTK